MTTCSDDSLDGAIVNLRVAEKTLEELDRKNYVINSYIALVLLDSVLDIIINAKLSHKGGVKNED